MKRLFIAIVLLLTAVLSAPAAHEQSSSLELLRSGPMLGASEMTETMIWLQTRRPAEAQVRFWKRNAPQAAHLSETVQTSEKNDFIARFRLANLDFGGRYDYEVYLDGKRLPLNFETSFQTQPMWRWRTPNSDPPNFKFAFGSCAYFNDPPFDRPGKPYGSGFEVFRAIANQKPDFMIWLGDNVYYREADWLTESAMRRRYAHDRETPELQLLLATTHNYAIWDDHDFGSNDSDRTFRLREASLKVFKDYWLNSSYGTTDTPGVFGRFEWGDTEFFLLDDRYHRSPNNAPDAPDKAMFGDAQMRWLTESLSNSRATFKIIAGGNQILNPIAAFEGFSRFPVEQKRLFDFIRDARINGVLFLSGDRHLTELIKRTDLGTYPLYDFTSSPLTSGNAKPHESEANNRARVAGTLVTDVKNFGVIEVVGKAGERKLILRTVDISGKELWRHEIAASELKFAAKP